MTPTLTRWESWRTTYRRRIRTELARRGWTMKQLAAELGFGNQSSLNYHTGGNGPTLDFVTRLAELWPEAMAGTVQEFLAARHGEAANESLPALPAREILAAVGELESAVTVLRTTIEAYITGGQDGEPSHASRHRRGSREGA